MKCRELHRTGFNARLRDELLSGEVFRSMASEMLLRSQRKLHHAFQELVRLIRPTAAKVIAQIDLDAEFPFLNGQRTV